MEEYSNRSVTTYWARIRSQNIEFLAGVRHFENLKLASDDQFHWVKDINTAQIESTDIKSIPYLELFEYKDNKLFRYRSNLPLMKAPSLLWTPITRGLPLNTPSLNHNFFGIDQKLDIRLITSKVPNDPTAMLVDIGELAMLMETVPSIRLSNLHWILIDNTKALIMGSPVLSIPGKTYWNQHDMLFPTGYNLELPMLITLIRNKITSDPNTIIFWIDSINYLVLNTPDFRKLTRSSFRLTMNRVQNRSRKEAI